ncbi:MAG: hypothetical protein ACP5D2_01365 [Candidatus Nanoarchaeia archaeon]
MALRKKFNDIEIPLINETVSILGSPETLPGQTIKLDMTRKMKGKGMEIVLKIYNQDDKFVAFPRKMHLLKFYIKRMMRKRASYVEDSFKTACKDGEIIIKPFLITRKKVSRAIRKNLRSNTKKLIIEYVSDKKYNELANDILSGNLQKEIYPKLKKIYPLSFCDIRVFETKQLDDILASHENNKEDVEEKQEKKPAEKTSKKTIKKTTKKTTKKK